MGPRLIHTTHFPVLSGLHQHLWLPAASSESLLPRCTSAPCKHPPQHCNKTENLFLSNSGQHPGSTFNLALSQSLLTSNDLIGSLLYGSFPLPPLPSSPHYFSQRAEFQVFLKSLIGLTFLPSSIPINTGLTSLLFIHKPYKGI